MAFPDELKTLARVFDFFCDNYLVGVANIDCSRQEIEIGSEFDELNCQRFGKRQGKVKDVLIQGYAIEGKLVRNSLVLVEDF